MSYFYREKYNCFPSNLAEYNQTVLGKQKSSEITLTKKLNVSPYGNEKETCNMLHESRFINSALAFLRLYRCASRNVVELFIVHAHRTKADRIIHRIRGETKEFIRVHGALSSFQTTYHKFECKRRGEKPTRIRLFFKCIKQFSFHTHQKRKLVGSFFYFCFI